MNDYIRSTFNRSMRIVSLLILHHFPPSPSLTFCSQWGTFPPKANYTNNISTDVSIQHWEYFEDNPLYDYIKNNYSVINSDDRVYIVQKYSTSYPNHLNHTFIFHGSPDGSAWSPNIFDITNSSNNPPRNSPYVVGHIAPQWNDYGANTSTYLEAYYSWRDGLPALADKQWGGNLSEASYAAIFETLQASAPAQNLDRVIPSQSSTILHYTFSSHPRSRGQKKVKDLSGNGYDASTNCSITRNSTLLLTPSCSLTTPLSSKGENYTLTLSLLPTSDTSGPILTGRDSVLFSFPSSPDFIAGGNSFALNYSLPISVWTTAEIVRAGNRTFFSANGGERMEFLTRVGINGERFAWAPMALNAPLAVLGGGEWEGEVGEVKLVDYAT
jgi:hexosaminidase